MKAIVYKGIKKVDVENVEDPKIEKDDDIIQKKIRLLINGLATCGLNASQVSNEDLRVVLDNFLNGGKTTEFGTVMPV